MSKSASPPSSAFRYRLTVQYDGTDYQGWQVQPGFPTIQETLERALSRITQSPVKIHGSGRTDQGVHAVGQVAHVDLARTWKPETLIRAMNALLPLDIRITSLRRAAPDFHARHSAIRKEYRYFIWNGAVVPLLQVRYRTPVFQSLDIQRMRAAAQILIGEHDFAAFAANPSRTVESTIRCLSLLTVTRRGSEIVIRAQSNGFLYRMVRSLAGYLIQVGEGRIPPAQSRAILASRQRTAQVPTAPPQGLFLWKVWY